MTDTTFPQQIQALVHRFADLWWESETTLPDLGREWSPREQAAREREMERFVDRLLAALRALPPAGPEREALVSRILDEGIAMGTLVLDLPEEQLRAIVSHGFLDRSADFSRQAQRFDSTISGDDIYQASRNVWTMNLFQLLLGQPMAVTPPVFAYSMLYPYSDNYLDDPAIPPATKMASNARLYRRLQGEPISPGDAHERTIYTLLEMIEGQFERARYPELYECLLAIQRAQERSLRLLHGGASPYEIDVLGISFDKGGTAALADGYLVNGTLDPAAQAFTFGYGAFTQLMDDLEDVYRDAREGRLTIFSQTARRWPLDAVVSRTIRLGAAVFGLMDAFPVSGLDPLKALIRRGVDLVLMDSAGQAGKLCSPAYRRELEAHMPVRFDFLARQRKKLASRKVSAGMLIEVL